MNTIKKISIYQTLILYKERPEILKILFTIIGQNSSDNFSEIKDFIDQIFSKYENSPEKLYPLLDIISSQIQINDHFTYARLIRLAGYPSLVVRPIPKEEDNNDNDNDNENNSNKSNSDNDNDSDKEEEKKKLKIKKNKTVKQKWPLFGEKLINGNINREIYEYLISDHNKNNRCLLSILFPSEYKLLDDNDNKMIKISEEKKKEILLDMIKSIFNERNNYPLFKYLYLSPSRSLLYKNLYTEIITYLNINKNDNPELNLDSIKKKEEQYIEFLEKEVKGLIDSAIKRDENGESNRYHFYRDDSDEGDFNDDIYEGKFFECRDKNMKFFTGFIADVIPGEVIREEIYGIAQKSELAMYRIHYYTKYYKTDELRDRLLNPDKYKKEENEEDKKSVKSDERESLKKSRSSSSSSRDKSLSSKKSKEEENK